jgi:hypothetical protein
MCFSVIGVSFLCLLQQAAFSFGFTKGYAYLFPISTLFDYSSRYSARDVVLAEWAKKTYLKFYKLRRNYRDIKRAWEEVDPGILFK